MTVNVLHGDCLTILPTLDAEAFHACVTDPPYHLTSIVKRFGGANAAPAQFGKDGAYARASAGFMGKKWDGGDIAFRPETWAEVLRVLKPGGHLLAFGATRGFHRMAVAIEDAGFEIRDTVMWLYGSGFPKSHDVSKGIDKLGGKPIAWFGPWLRRWRHDHGISQKQVAENFPSVTGGMTGCVANWELGLNIPSPEQFNKIRDIFNLPFESIEVLERQVISQRTTGLGTGNGSVAIMGDGSRDITAPASEASHDWAGWGTALKPAWEPIIVARKPLAGTVAANTLQHRCGGLNIDGCRVPTDENLNGGAYAEVGGRKESQSLYAGSGMNVAGKTTGLDFVQPHGRWPANVLHDGSEEVVSAFPAAPGQQGDLVGHNKPRPTNNCFGDMAPAADHMKRGDVGSAARFFYSAKADATDRAGSKHPTVKPLDLMRYLVRLVTPPKGHVLDCFAGSGSTGEAAMLEGFHATLIEREAEYVEDIRRRLGRPSGVDLPLFAP